MKFFHYTVFPLAFQPPLLPPNQYVYMYIHVHGAGFSENFFVQSISAVSIIVIMVFISPD